MRLKKKKEYKAYVIQLRLTEKDKNRLKQKANIYTEGNVSELLLYAGLNFIADKNELEQD